MASSIDGWLLIWYGTQVRENVIRTLRYGAHGKLESFDMEFDTIVERVLFNKV